MNNKQGFSLLEVLIALAIIAIALTALLKANSQTIKYNQRIKDKLISHWVAMQGVNMIQLGLLPVPNDQEITQVTTMLDQKWYWRAKMENLPLKKVQLIKISLSQEQSGPFADPLYAFRYSP